VAAELVQSRRAGGAITWQEGGVSDGKDENHSARWTSPAQSRMSSGWIGGRSCCSGRAACWTGHRRQTASFLLHFSTSKINPQSQSIVCPAPRAKQIGPPSSQPPASPFSAGALSALLSHKCRRDSHRGKTLSMRGRAGRAE
jgi:hypothetical protein